jgi:hypothetical protein
MTHGLAKRDTRQRSGRACSPRAVRRPRRGEPDGSSDRAPLLAVQLAWAVALLAVGRLVLRRAVARVVVQGG